MVVFSGFKGLGWRHALGSKVLGWFRLRFRFRVISGCALVVIIPVIYSVLGLFVLAAVIEGSVSSYEGPSVLQEFCYEAAKSHQAQSQAHPKQEPGRQYCGCLHRRHGAPGSRHLNTGWLQDAPAFTTMYSDEPLCNFTCFEILFSYWKTAFLKP